jgi:tetratricopeptide (TPR) repeat protein
VDFAQKYGGDGKDAYKTHDNLEAEWQNLEGVATTLREIAGIPGELKDRQAAQMLIDLEEALYNFLYFRGYWDEGARLSEWRYQAGKALSQWSDAGWGAFNVAWIHYNRGETDRAATWAAHQMVEAMERGGNRRKLGNEADVAIDLNDLGGLARSQGQYDRAESYYKQALAIAKKLGLKQEEAYISGNLGTLALDRDRPTEARLWYERQLVLAQEVGRQDLVAGAQAGLARVLEEEERYTEALPLAQSALEIRERLRDQNLDFSRRLVERLQRKAGME